MGMVHLRMDVPVGTGPNDNDPRAQLIRALKAGVDLLENAHPMRGMPLSGTLRDNQGHCGSYHVVLEEG